MSATNIQSIYKVNFIEHQAYIWYALFRNIVNTIDAAIHTSYQYDEINRTVWSYQVGCLFTTSYYNYDASLQYLHSKSVVVISSSKRFLPISSSFDPTFIHNSTASTSNSAYRNYRKGFQGQEKDDEIKGEGNSVNYTFRMHDTRLGRFFAVDPLFKKYPYYSPYQFSGNRVIDAVEIEGLEPSQVNVVEESAGGSTTSSTTQSYVENGNLSGTFDVGGLSTVNLNNYPKGSVVTFYITPDKIIKEQIVETIDIVAYEDPFKQEYYANNPNASIDEINEYSVQKHKALEMFQQVMDEANYAAKKDEERWNSTNIFAYYLGNADTWMYENGSKVQNTIISLVPPVSMINSVHTMYTGETIIGDVKTGTMDRYVLPGINIVTSLAGVKYKTPLIGMTPQGNMITKNVIAAGYMNDAYNIAFILDIWFPFIP